MPSKPANPDTAPLRWRAIHREIADLLSHLEGEPGNVPPGNARLVRMAYDLALHLEKLCQDLLATEIPEARATTLSLRRRVRAAKRRFFAML